MESKMSLVDCPYVEGAKYVLDFKPGTNFGEPFKALSKLKVTVLNPFNPFTISPVLKVKLEQADQQTNIPAGSTLVLKLFDPRFATDLRKSYTVPNLTLTLAKKYRTCPQRRSKTLEEWDNRIDELKTQHQELAPLEKEAYLETLLYSYYECETKVYDKLTELQGKGIPKFFGQTRFAIDSSSHPSIEADVPGILLEYIGGHKLEELPPELFHDSIGTSALDVVSVLSDKEILNYDVRFDNFIVPSSDIGRPVVMIDFAQCDFRGEDESDQEWYDSKAHQDEEGAVGYPLRKNFGWKYQPSFRYVILE